MLKRIISFALVLLTLSWMGVIFSFSCENGGESAESSGRFIRKIVSVIDGDFDTLSPEEQTKIVEKYDHFVRKTAHFSIYAVLELVYTAHVRHYLKRTHQMRAAVLFGILAKERIHPRIREVLHSHRVYLAYLASGPAVTF
mgnify:CR=1 FL=1